MSRLIDADALIEQMEADAEQMEDSIAKMFTYAAINDVKHAPTIEPERKPGKWLDDPDEYKCSACGAYFEIECGDGEMNFCPNCGSDMRGNQDENN